jgi:hypothetical protein
MTDKKAAIDEGPPAAAPSGKSEKLKLQARMFDMGHAPKERVANRVFEKVNRDGKTPTDERLHEILADEHTREDIQEIYG